MKIIILLIWLILSINRLIDILKHVLKKKGQKICRFNFPLPPMRKTMVLSPLSKESFTDDQLKDIKDRSEKRIT